LQNVDKLREFWKNNVNQDGIKNEIGYEEEHEIHQKYIYHEIRGQDTINIMEKYTDEKDTPYRIIDSDDQNVLFSRIVEKHYVHIPGNNNNYNVI